MRSFLNNILLNSRKHSTNILLENILLNILDNFQKF